MQSWRSSLSSSRTESTSPATMAMDHEEMVDDNSIMSTTTETVSFSEYMNRMRPFWWLYLALLVLLAVTILYLRRGLIMDKCRRKEAREQVCRMDISTVFGEVMVHHPPPPSYDQAMGLAPQPPTQPELPPKHSPEPIRKHPNAFAIWIA